MKTTVLKGNKNIERKWHLIDLKGETLGRISTKIAGLLIGKDRVDFSYHRDDGDYVIAINADQIQVTGKKKKQKIYYHHTAWAGHLKELTYNQLFKKDPRKVIYHSVHGMIPKNKLRDRRMTRLKIFVGSEHNFTDKLTTK